MDETCLSLFCANFHLKVDFFLKHRGQSAVGAWRDLQEKKKWTTCELNEIQKKFQKTIQNCDKNILYPEHESYPDNYLKLESPPVYLNYRGDIALLKELRLSVIGSRNPSLLFIRWMENEYAQVLKQRDFVSVSGGAVGIDQKASELALFYNKPTVVIVPSGLSRMYPKNLRNWEQCKNLLFISEYLPSQEMRKYHFYCRNRLIAALTNKLFVVQCAIKSGSMITVRQALDLGVSIATIPDFPHSVESSGNLQLLRDGAQMISNHEDLKIFLDTTIL